MIRTCSWGLGFSGFRVSDLGFRGFGFDVYGFRALRYNKSYVVEPYGIVL